jgi:hypothetical protein
LARLSGGAGSAQAPAAPACASRQADATSLAGTRRALPAATSQTLLDQGIYEVLP